jgi:cytochrome c-type biogenesis protein CcmH/NrfG
MSTIAKLILKAETLLENASYKAAEHVLREVIKEDDTQVEAYYLLGEVLCKQTQFSESVTMLEKANKLQPEHPRILHLLGWAIFMNGDPSRGRELLLKALILEPDDTKIICDLAVLENQTENSDKAIQYATVAQRIAPEDPMVQEVLMVTNMMKDLRSKVNKSN